MASRGWPVGVKAAIIGGVFVLFAAAIAIVPWLFDRLSKPDRESPDIQIIDLVYLAVEGKLGVNAVLWNKSGRPLAVTSFRVIWSQGEHPEPPFPFAFVIGPSQVYSLEPTIDLSRQRGRGAVEGTVALVPEKADVGAIRYPIKGSCAVYPNGAWFLGFDFPIREQLNADENISLSMVIPQTLPVVGVSAKFAKGFPGEVLPDLARYTSGDPPEAFRLQDFLKDRGITDVSLHVTYADDRRTALTKKLRLSADRSH